MKACELWGYSPIHTFVPQILLSSCHKAHAVLGGVGGGCGSTEETASLLWGSSWPGRGRGTHGNP